MLHFHAAMTYSTHMVTFVSQETRRFAPLAALFCSSSHFFACFNQRFEGTSCISISFGHFCNLFPLIIRIHTSLTWSSRPPSSPRILVSFGVRSVVPSSFFVLAFLQVESVGGLIVERKVPLFHPCDYSPLSSFVNNLTYYLSSLPLATMLAQRKSRSRRQSRRFSPNHKNCRPLQGM